MCSPVRDPRQLTQLGPGQMATKVQSSQQASYPFASGVAILIG